MKQLIVMIISLLLLSVSCSSHKNLTTETVKEASSVDTSCSMSDEQNKETTIEWFFDSSFDSLSWPSLTLPRFTQTTDSAPKKAKSALPKFGFIKILTSATNSVHQKQKKEQKNKLEEQKQEVKKTPTKYKHDWKITAIVSAFAVLLCQCVINRKKNATFLRKYLVVPK